MSRLRVGLIALALLGCVAAASAQCQLKITDLYTCDRDGKRATPKLGDESYGIRVEWTVTGTPNSDYLVRFQMGDASANLRQADLVGPGPHQATWFFTMPLGGKIPFSVQLDPDGTSGHSASDPAFLEKSFVPTPPKQPIEFYDPHTWFASQSITLTLPATSSSSRGVAYFGKPTSESFQEVLNDPGMQGMTEGAAPPFDYPVMRLEGSRFPAGDITLEHKFSVRCSSARSNLAQLMISWDSFRHVPMVASPYLDSETVIPKDDPAIAEFVKSVLPKDYRQTMSPYRAARALFVAVAHKLTYVSSDFQKLEFEPSNALFGLKTGQGDSGTYSALYVASLRSIGIPARCEQGWVAGNDHWEGWCEIYVPGAGWMPQDVAACHRLWHERGEQGDYAYYFDVDPSKCRTVCSSRGSTFVLEQWTVESLQAGMVKFFGYASAPKYVLHCSLTPEKE